ncbi:hypothetical protein VP01_1049g1 [Puccinia sorghi]|uniref:PPIase cyclophilin-type domain-containing protein n=1 Tax=Puccinia sorghi TaxID=27349 RepID=A0A0L6VUB0_9BASI|nr:hypothetical protein VP01_1049g1 [Puccinia sorghi]
MFTQLSFNVTLLVLIITDRTEELQDKHTIFGSVIGDTIYNVMKLGEVEIGKNERPVHPPLLFILQARTCTPSLGGPLRKYFSNRCNKSSFDFVRTLAYVSVVHLHLACAASTSA